ncbi:MAG TPA: ArsA-related P-loop ATPase [Myxococcota bacterium]|nr:ArsA-related P-loop ATPase [Myxococcota bacterium]
MPTRAEPVPLQSRRLVLVTGKGGTGKTTIAAAIAQGAVARGLRVCVAELGRDSVLPRLLASRPPQGDYPEREIRPGLFAIRIDPYEALAEYFGIEIGLRGLARRVLAQRGFRQLLEAAPGWRELIELGKVWHLEQMREGGRPSFDLIVVDAPATGHGVSFLDVPRVVISAVRAGPLRHHTEEVEALLRDARRTLVLPVSLAEELPARETRSLVTRVRELGLAVDRVVVNGVRAQPVPDEAGDLVKWLDRLPPEAAIGALPRPPVLAACVRALVSRHALGRHYCEEIAASTGLPIVTLPYLADGIRGPQDVAMLADAVLAPPHAEVA